MRETTTEAVLDRLEAELAAHVGALHALSGLAAGRDDSELQDLFETLAVSGASVLRSLEFWRDELKQQEGAMLGGHEPLPAAATLGDDAHESG